MPSYTLTVSGRAHAVDVEADTPLLWVLRDVFGLTGTKYGCGQGVCGACAVHESGRAVRSCLVPITEANGRAYTTIEGLAAPGASPAAGRPAAPPALHPVQQAWIDLDVSQCGYCQPGMIMTAVALLARTPSPSDADIDAAMADSVCRCGTYNRMREAIKRAAAGKAGR